MRATLPLLVGLSLLAGCTVPFGIGERYQPPGAAARDLVSPRAYANLLVEIDHPPGFEPHAVAIDVLRSTLADVTGRPTTSIQIDTRASIPAESGKRYRWSEIDALERQHRDHRTGGDTAVLYVLYVAGGSENDTDEGKVLGAVYGGTSVVMFKGNIRTNAGGGPLSTRPSEDVIERAVLVHEFGHAAGLVNLGTRMVTPHEDPEHRGHSSNKDSVMYWAVESTLGLSLLCQVGLPGNCGVPYQFDAHDKADLKALRES